MAGSAAMLAACGMTARAPRVGADGRPLPKVYHIRKSMTNEIPYRVLDSINALRAARGSVPLALNAQLNAAALTHSRDMSVQNRPWHFGSDGSSPLLRVQRVGYPGKLLGELISETYEDETATLATWMGQADTRDVILNPEANAIGFAWYQEESGKIWWTLLTGA